MLPKITLSNVDVHKQLNAFLFPKKQRKNSLFLKVTPKQIILVKKKTTQLLTHIKKYPDMMHSEYA
jgi:hypothetical protein